MVGAALWLWDPADPRLEQGDVPVWDFTVEEVLSLDIERGDEHISLVREGEWWTMQSPFSTAADDGEVEFLLERLARIRSARLVASVDLEEYGLAPTQATVRIGLSDGTSVSLQLGDEAPTGHRTYARNDAGQVLVLPVSVADVVTTEVSVLRERRILFFDPAEVRRVTIESDNGVLEVAGSGTDWFLTDFARVDVHTLDGLVLGVQGLRFLSFSPDTAPDGIAEPAFRVTVASADAEWSFSVGEQGPMGTYIRRDDGLSGYADPDQLALLAQGPLELALRNPFRFDPAMEDEVVLTLNDRVVTLRREEGNWTGSEALEPLIEALSNARITYLREPVPALRDQRGEVVVTRASGRRTHVALFQEEGEYLLAQDVDGGQPFRIERAAIGALLERL